MKKTAAALLTSALLSSPAMAEEVGVWCDVMVPGMTSLDALVTLVASDNDKHTITIAFQDGSKNTTVLTKRGSRYATDNRFGEYYTLRNDGQLGIYDSEGFVRAARPARAGAKPGACR